MSFPRGTALAEVGWTPAEAKDCGDFRRRLGGLLPRLDILGVNDREPAETKEIGRWRPAEMSETWKPMSWDVTEHLTVAGGIEFIFGYTNGKHRLDIRWAELLENGKVVSRDSHLGTAGTRHDGNRYRFDLPKIDPRAEYVIRASVRSGGGTDSNGDILMRTGMSR
jgi:hexosaminidase